LKKLIKNLLGKIWLEEVAHRYYLAIRHLWRKIVGIDRKIINDYFKNHDIKAFHIGCGINVRNDWLNADYFPQSDRVMHIDATKRLPFVDNAFDYVFSEHMIEHIPYPAGLNLLSECHRILKPNAIIRITTPDLSFLINLYGAEKSELQEKYIKWSIETFLPTDIPKVDTFVFNTFVREWGHKFIYDEKVLRDSFQKAGFTNITKCKLNESEHDILRDLTNENRMPPGFLVFESFTLEATKD